MPVRHRNRHARKRFPVPAWRFREARLSCFLTVEACADLLRVSVRTVQNWESGAVRIPYAAFKLMRVLCGGKVLGSEWRGFSIRADKLHTPEGHTFQAGDLAWWSLLVRQARAFRDARRELRDLQDAAAASAVSAGPKASAAAGVVVADRVGASASAANVAGSAAPVDGHGRPAVRSGSTAAGATPAKRSPIDAAYQCRTFSPSRVGGKGSGAIDRGYGPGSNTGHKGVAP